MEPSDAGRLLIVAGLAVAVVGIWLALGGRLPWFGNLPGDLVFHWDGVTLHVPLGTMVVVSVALTVLLNLVARLFR